MSHFNARNPIMRDCAYRDQDGIRCATTDWYNNRARIAVRDNMRCGIYVDHFGQHTR